jgi:translation initiation factor eIF-2B subunit epsilon
MVYSQLLPGHAGRCHETEFVLGLDSGRVISHQKIKPDESILPVSVELLQGHTNIELRYDLLDPCINICSLTVPPIFSDNFDFQTKDDFVKGLLLNEDILGHTMYAHILEDSYATRASTLSSYLAARLDYLYLFGSFLSVLFIFFLVLMY